MIEIRRHLYLNRNLNDNLLYFTRYYGNKSEQRGQNAIVRILMKIAHLYASMVEATKRKVQFMHVHHAFMYSIHKHEYDMSFICIYRLCLRLKKGCAFSKMDRLFAHPCHHLTYLLFYVSCPCVCDAP